MIDIEKLKALALAATPTPWTEAALKLIAEVERLTCELQNQREIAQHWKASAGYISAHAAGTVEKDTARLNFMLENEYWVGYNPENTHCRVLHQDDDGDIVPVIGTADMNWFTSACEAIDAAIEAHNKAGKEQG